MQLLPKASSSEGFGVYLLFALSSEVDVSGIRRCGFAGVLVFGAGL